MRRQLQPKKTKVRKAILAIYTRIFLHSRAILSTNTINTARVFLLMHNMPLENLNARIDILRKLEPEDLMQYGLIPEFIRRMPVVTVQDSLDEQSLRAILTEPCNVLVKQFQTLLSMDNVQLVFEEHAIETIAQEAVRRQTGARGLCSLVEDLMLDVMYSLPGQCLHYSCSQNKRSYFYFQKTWIYRSPSQEKLSQTF